MAYIAFTRIAEMTMKSCSLMLALAFCIALAPAASAQYPAKPVRLVVPFAAGGSSDTAARTLGQALAKSLGQAVIVENRPGANGAIAAQAVLASPPDGYTLLWGVASMVALPLLQKNAPYESLAEFTPVAIVGSFDFSLFVNPDIPARTVTDFMAYARANPGKLSYASSGWGEFMAAEQFMKAAGISMVRVPYKGGAQAASDLIAGRVQATIGPTSNGLQYAKGGQLRMLAMLSTRRSALAPDVPTMAEAGVPGVFVPTWQAVFAPPKTPRGIVDRLSRETSLAMKDPEVRARFEQQSLLAVGSTPEVLAAAIKEDQRSWAQFVRDNGTTPE
jgi:tripartite-type tricarboxylate transporter receptor subunit TctC